MEIEAGDDILRKAAEDGSLDYAAWPDLLPLVLARIEKIAHTEFPIPAITSPVRPARPPSPRFLAPLPSSDPVEAPDQTNPPPTSSQETDKENAKPSPPSLSRGAGTSANAGPASSAPAASSSQPSAPTQQHPVTAPLPKPIADMLDEVLTVLRTDFPQYPPHTIQRLAELVLRPREHYRNVVPYLHALDRIVHVTSGANTYPLPPALPDIGAMTLLANGVGGRGAGGLSVDTAAANNLGSDEALGGALLTPIPWLSRRANAEGSDDGGDAGSSSPLSASGNPSQQFQLQQHQQRQSSHLEGRIQTENTVTIEGPNGMGSIETVSVSVNGIPSTGAGVAMLTQRSVTQGELLRQEQRAGVVPLNQLNRQQQRHRPMDTDGGDTADEDASMSDGAAEEEEEEEIPHARGPEEIGPADTGPQDPTTANYIAGAGRSLGVGRLNLEAAVGRRVQTPPTQQQEQPDGSKRASGSPDGEIIQRSPKREATDKLEAAVPKKRIREDGSTISARSSGGESQDQGQEGATGQQQKSADDKAASGDGEADSEPKRDAEGDVVLSDVAAEQAGEDEPAVDDSSENKSEAATKDEGRDRDDEGDSKTVQDGEASTGATAAESGPGSQGG
ncbi:uncharacterized protein B0T15DRAFT_5357 [Chaetomium strumarium]|uniref:Uncharacterized protein n=1 Tax=Chaetomium strumarium TaxID=1170767 RepID=A0AAJ0M577_9PEZI|nr:hypothetical protein B0T15DRAFT_5357 [Chaetomium strumarium]